MFDRLIDLLISSLRLFLFFTVMAPYERGVVLRLGKFHRVLEPGFHWVWPFHIEHVLSTIVVDEPIVVGPQSLTTADGVGVVVTVVVTQSVFDAKTFLLEVEGGNEIIRESAYRANSEIVMNRQWAQLCSAEYDYANELAKIVRRNVKAYGVAVSRVGIIDFTRSRSFRLIQPDSKTLAHVQQ